MRWLDYRADPGLEAALAAAAQVAPGRLEALRIVPGDGSTSCWHRDGVAWCRACIQEDLARWGETYERAIWRLGCCVLCQDHGVLLKDQCRRRYPASRAHFRHADGRMTLVCAQCARLPDPLKGEDTDADDSQFLAFDLVATPGLTRIVLALQADLVGALAGVAPDRPGGILRSAGGLIDAVASLVAGIGLGRNMRFKHRVDWFATARSTPWAVAYELFTPADASVDCAFGAYSDETARVYRSETAHRSNLKPPTIPVPNRPGWCCLVGRFRHVTRAKSGSSNRRQRVCIGC